LNTYKNGIHKIVTATGNTNMVLRLIP